MGWKEIIEAGLTFVFVIVGGLSFGWFRILKETNQLLKDQNAELKADNKEWQTKHAENEKAISKMQGQIDTIKDIPLRQINNHMEQQTQVNKQILNFMQTFVPTSTTTVNNNA